MKWFWSILTAALACLPSMQAVAFVNLDFEAARPPYTVVPEGPPGHEVLVSEVLPGWTAWYGAEQSLTMSYNVLSLGGSAISLTDQQYPRSDIGLISGYNTLTFFAGRGSFPLAPLDVAVSQVGTIPANARSMTFLSWHAENGASLAISFAGSPLAFQFAQQLPSGVSLYSADVSSFAGITGELRFTALAPRPYGLSVAVIDDIGFMVPEPQASLLLAIGLLGVGFRRWRKSHGTS